MGHAAVISFLPDSDGFRIKGQYNLCFTFGIHGLNFSKVLPLYLHDPFSGVPNHKFPLWSLYK